RARAEFIRGQCQAARLVPGDKRAAAIEARCQELLRDFGDAWAVPLRAACKSTFHGWYRRGFVYRVETDDRHIARRFPAAAALCPVTELTIDNTYDLVTAADLRALARRPELSRLRRLELEYVPPADSIPLLESPHLRGLEALRVRGHDITDAARAVAG